MKKILSITGSPRKNGNTIFLMNKIVDHIKPIPETINHFSLYDYEIGACTDCRACKEGELKCVLKDGMTNWYNEIENSDILLLGTPIYWSSPSGKMKLFMDRLRPYYSNQKLKGKKAVLLLPAGDGAADCDLTIEIFKRAFKALGIEILGIVTSKAYDVGDSEKDIDAANQVEELAASLVDEIRD